MRVMKRINGELCAFNTVEIIKRYNPRFWIIENPAFGRLWEYIEVVMGFELPYKNHAQYNNYDYPISKPTRFSGNIDLKLKNEKMPNEVNFKTEFSKSYNERSNIPSKLVKEIFQKVYRKFLEVTDE